MIKFQRCALEKYYYQRKPARHSYFMSDRIKQDDFHDPLSVVRDHRLKEMLTAQGINVHSLIADLLYEPWEVNDGNDSTCVMFAPVWNKRLSMPYDPDALCYLLKEFCLGIFQNALRTLLYLKMILKEEAMHFLLVCGHLDGEILIKPLLPL